MNLEECFNYISLKLNLKIYTEEQPKTIRAYAIHMTCQHTPEEFNILKQAKEIEPFFSPETKIEFLKLEFAKSKESPDKDMLIFSFYHHSDFLIGESRTFAYPEPTPKALQIATYEKQVVWYPNGNAWTFPSNKTKKSYPCSLKDFFYYQDKTNAAYSPFLLLFRYLGQFYPIFKDLASDFQQGSAYTSIPIQKIFSCGSRRELLGKYYGTNGMKRNNRECIGDGIFLYRAERLIPKEQIQRLYGFHCYPVFIGRKKTDMINPLTYYLHETLKSKFPDMQVMIRNPEVDVPEKIPVRISKDMIRDAVFMAIFFKRKIPVVWNSLQTFYDWHNELFIRYREKSLPVVSIPKDSIYKRLKMPKGCVRLTTRKQFIEEGNYNNNCVASYIPSVNKDICSIWSMRKLDGRRFTIEIKCRRSKHYSDGYFYIGQMSGWGNSDVPESDYQEVRKCLEKQMIPKRTKDS